MKVLNRKFQNGDISKTEDLETVQDTEEVFKEHKLENLRSCFNRTKKQYFESEKSCRLYYSV